MSAIADEADISKSLLFYYFKNKAEYYLYLFDTAIEFVNEKKGGNINDKKYDLFELVSQTVERRMKMICEYPYLYKFIAKAYYEEFEDIKHELDKRKNSWLKLVK